MQGSGVKQNNIFMLRFIIATTSVIYLIVVKYNSNNNVQVSVIMDSGNHDKSKQPLRAISRLCIIQNFREN